MNRADERGNERWGRGGGISSLWTCAGMVAVACSALKLLALATGVRDAEETVRWLVTVFKRVLTHEFQGGRCSTGVTKSAFIVPLVFLALAVGFYIGFTFARAIEEAEETLQRLSNSVRRIRAAVCQFFGLGHPAIEEIEIEG